MSFYEDLVMRTQMNYNRYYGVYASGGTPYALSENKPLTPEAGAQRLVEEIQ